jgi:hypothetical protein
LRWRPTSGYRKRSAKKEENKSLNNRSIYNVMRSNKRLVSSVDCG